MAKKYEFKPDKPLTGFLSRLYLTQKQRRALLKWLFYSLFLLALSILQDVLLCRVRLWGATTELVPCGIILICLAEGVEQGSVFALIASSLYLFSGSAAGIYSIVFITALAVFVTLFRQGYLKKCFNATMLCVTMALPVYELAVFALGLFLGLTTADRFLGFLLTAAYTLLTAPIMYPVISAISNFGGDAWKE